MVARVLFPVLTCGATRSRPQHRATLRWGLDGRPRLVPCAHLWGNAITPPAPGDPTMDRRLEPLRRSIVGAMACPRPVPLVLALPYCTLSFIRQHSPLWSPALLFPLKGCRPRYNKRLTRLSLPSAQGGIRVCECSRKVC